MHASWKPAKNSKISITVTAWTLLPQQQILILKIYLPLNSLNIHVPFTRTWSYLKLVPLFSWIKRLIFFHILACTFPWDLRGSEYEHKIKWGLNCVHFAVFIKMAVYAVKDIAHSDEMEKVFLYLFLLSVYHIQSSLVLKLKWWRSKKSKTSISVIFWSAKFWLSEQTLTGNIAV